MNTIQTGIYKADAYYRLSKEDGDKSESDSIVNQKALVREFLKSHPDIQIHGERVDDGYTGVNFERPAFQKMLDDIRSGIVNCVIVKDLSRFGRNYIETGRYIEKIFPYLGVRFIAINDNIDTASGLSAAEEMIIPFKNLINDAYCRDISVKVRSHLDIKKKNGQFVGAFSPYGYKKSPKNKNQLVVDEKAAAVIQQIFKWKLEGMSGTRIAARLNELGVPTPMQYKQMNGEHYQCGFVRNTVSKWDANGVNRILQNKMYIGTLVQGKTVSPSYKVRKRQKKDEKDWICCEHAHEAIVSEEEYRMVNGMFREDTKVSPNNQKLHLFSGFAKCGYCGGNMTRKMIPVKGKTYVYLVCGENKKKTGCGNNRYISLERFEQAVLHVINLQIERVFELEQMMKFAESVPYRGAIAEKLQENIMDKEMEMIKKREYASSAYQDFKEGILSRDEYLELKECFHGEIAVLKQAIEALQIERERAVQSRTDTADWVKYFVRHRGFTELTREILLNLVDMIKVYDKDRIEVIFRFKEQFEMTAEYLQMLNRKKSSSMAAHEGGME